MLKTSPVLASSANASPASFRHAHAHAHAPAPIHVPAPGAFPTTPRRSPRAASSSASASASGSVASMKSPASVPASARLSHHRPVAASSTASASASALASASVSDDYAGSSAALDLQSSASRGDPSQAAPTSGQHLLSMTRPTADQQPVPSAPPPIAASGTSRDIVPLSPVKRRGSPGTSIPIQASTACGPQSAAAAESSASSASKRARPDERPPKVLPQRYELCAVEDIVELIAHMLSELITTNDAIPLVNRNLTRFHSR
jgi:hypothetical protein